MAVISKYTLAIANSEDGGEWVCAIILTLSVAAAPAWRYCMSDWLVRWHKDVKKVTTVLQFFQRSARFKL